MEIKLYNTLSKKKEVFVPLRKGHVNMYGCGPTVYWYQHIGNLKRYVGEDIIKRVFLYNNYKVKHVINVTDVGHLTSDADEGEDKIEKAAKREGKSAKEITEYYFKIFRDDLKKLNFIEPDFWPRATENIKGMIDLVKTLKKKGFTYETSDGIYFDTSKLDDYGKLIGKNVELEAGKRIAVGEKRNPRDFALWKFSSEGEKRQQEWKAFGKMGFPGWHIECSVMSSRYLGKQFDIHTGGQEHIAVHHTNEIAQSESAFGKKPWVKYWIHFAWLLFKGEKVSKSKGGAYTLSQMEEKNYSPLAFRYMCLLTHYKKPLNFTIEVLESAMRTYLRLKNIISEMKKSKEKKNKKNIEAVKQEFLKIINDDFNLPRGIAYMWEILRDEKLNDAEKYELVLDFDKVFGLDLDKEEEKEEIPKEIEKLVKERERARNKQDWARADEFREKINKEGYAVEDKKEGVVVKKR